jgi:hypothetical protein
MIAAPGIRTLLNGWTEPVRHPHDREAALYALLLRLRREERFGEYGEFVRQFEDEFGAQPYFHTFRAIHARAKGDLASLRSSVEYCVFSSTNPNLTPPTSTAKSGQARIAGDGRRLGADCHAGLRQTFIDKDRR